MKTYLHHAKALCVKLFFSIYLLSCLTIPFLGAWIWTLGYIHTARQDAKATIEKGSPPEESVLWVFSREQIQTELQWEHSREFEYKGEMYDIICAEARGDSMWYWCYHDRKETHVRKSLRSILARIAGTTLPDQSRQQWINDFFKNVYIPSSSRNSGCNYTCVMKAATLYVESFFDDICIHPLHPPPETS